MKFTISKTDLASAMGQVIRVIQGNSVLATLSNVYIEADGDRIHFTGTDLNTSLRIHRDGDTSVEGTVLVNASKFNEIVAKLPNDTVSCVLVDNQMEIKCGKAKLTVPTAPQKDFPVFPVIEKEASVELNAEEFRRALKLTEYAVDRLSGARYGGLFLKGNQDAVTVFGTDAGQLATFDIPASGAEGFESCLHPDAVELLQALVKGEDGDIHVGCNHATAQFETDRFTLNCRILDLAAPNQRRILDACGGLSVTMPREALLATLRRALLLASEAYSTKEGDKVVVGGKVICDIRSDINHNPLLAVSSRSQSGTFFEEIPIETELRNIDFAFNAGLMTGFLSSRKGEKVTLSIKDAICPIKMTTSAENEGVGVVMPMTIKD